MSPESVQSLIALALGFAIAGLATSGYQLATSQLPSFGLLKHDVKSAAVASVPLLVIAAPFLIMRNTLMGTRYESRRFEFVLMATILAGLWSLMSGTVLVLTLQAVGVLAA
ncbi:MAG: hypothetical protein JO237_05825 [Pseudolabrys sp.]|nr:hypothetical protein [Pseudolabrys sp.]